MPVRYYANYRDLTITRVEVERATYNSVLVDGKWRRLFKREHGGYHVSFEAAKSDLVSICETDLGLAELSLRQAKRRLDHVRSLTEPDMVPK